MSAHLTSAECRAEIERQMTDQARTVLRLTTSLPPSSNSAYANAAKGRRLTPKGRVFKRDLHHLANQAGAQTIKIRAPYSLSLIVYFPDTRRSDVSNRVKLVEDALMEAIGGDDTDVRTIWLEKRISRDNPRCEIVLEGAEPDIEEES